MIGASEGLPLAGCEAPALSASGALAAWECPAAAALPVRADTGLAAVRALDLGAVALGACLRPVLGTLHVVLSGHNVGAAVLHGVVVGDHATAGAGLALLAKDLKEPRAHALAGHLHQAQ